MVVRQAKGSHGTNIRDALAHCLHCVLLKVVDDYLVEEDILLCLVLNGSLKTPYVTMNQNFDQSKLRFLKVDQIEVTQLVQKNKKPILEGLVL